MKFRTLNSVKEHELMDSQKRNKEITLWDGGCIQVPKKKGKLCGDLRIRIQTRIHIHIYNSDTRVRVAHRSYPSLPPAPTEGKKGKR